MDKLRLRDGRTVYVEPQAAGHNQGTTLLLGEPTYTWTRRDSTFTLDPAPGLAGVVLLDGDTLPVPRPPVPGVVTHFRLLADGSDYAVIFAITDSSSVGTRSTRVRSYWFGRTDGRRWYSLERLPHPTRPLHAARASQLLRVAGTLMIAAPIGEGTDHDAAIFALTPAGWRLDTVALANVAYVGLAERGARLFMYAVHADTAAMSDINSLWLLERVGAAWQSRGMLRRGGSSPIHLLRVVTGARGPFLTWVQRRADGDIPRMASLAADGTLADDRFISIRVEHGSVATVGSGMPWWGVSQRTAPGARLARVESNGRTAVIRDAITSPFTGPFIAIDAGDARIAIGPLHDPHSKEEQLVSGIVRFVERCAERVAPEAP